MELQGITIKNNHRGCAFISSPKKKNSNFNPQKKNSILINFPCSDANQIVPPITM